MRRMLLIAFFAPLYAGMILTGLFALPAFTLVLWVVGESSPARLAWRAAVGESVGELYQILRGEFPEPDDEEF